MTLFFKYFFSFLVLFVCIISNGQTNQSKEEYFNSTIKERKFDEQKWQELVKDFDYSEKLFEDYDEAFDTTQTNPNKTGVAQSDKNSGFDAAFWAGFFQILFICIVVIVITILLINILGAGDIFVPRSRKISLAANDFSIEKIEANFHETDLEKFIREAVEQKKYALAIRLYYLAIIKELSLSKMIKWKRDKTNRSYLDEIRTTGLFQPFREATRIFERVWYGEGILDEKEYLSVKPKFDQLIKAAQAKGSANETD